MQRRPKGTRSVWTIVRSEEHTSELQSHLNLVCRLLLEKKKSDRDAGRVSGHCRDGDCCRPHQGSSGTPRLRSGCCRARQRYTASSSSVTCVAPSSDTL